MTDNTIILETELFIECATCGEDLAVTLKETRSLGGERRRVAQVAPCANCIREAEEQATEKAREVAE